MAFSPIPIRGEGLLVGILKLAAPDGGFGRMLNPSSWNKPMGGNGPMTPEEQMSMPAAKARATGDNIDMEAQKRLGKYGPDQPISEEDANWSNQTTPAFEQARSQQKDLTDRYQRDSAAYNKSQAAKPAPGFPAASEAMAPSRGLVGRSADVQTPSPRPGASDTELRDYAKNWKMSPESRSQIENQVGYDAGARDRFDSAAGSLNTETSGSSPYFQNLPNEAVPGGPLSKREAIQHNINQNNRNTMADGPYGYNQQTARTDAIVANADKARAGAAMGGGYQNVDPNARNRDGFSALAPGNGAAKAESLKRLGIGNNEQQYGGYSNGELGQMEKDKKYRGLVNDTNTGTGTQENRFMTKNSPTNVMSPVRDSATGKEITKGPDAWTDYKQKMIGYNQALESGAKSPAELKAMNPGGWHGGAGNNRAQDEAAVWDRSRQNAQTRKDWIAGGRQGPVPKPVTAESVAADEQKRVQQEQEKKQVVQKQEQFMGRAGDVAGKVVDPLAKNVGSAAQGYIAPIAQAVQAGKGWIGQQPQPPAAANVASAQKPPASPGDAKRDYYVAQNNTAQNHANLIPPPPPPSPPPSMLAQKPSGNVTPGGTPAPAPQTMMPPAPQTPPPAPTMLAHTDTTLAPPGATFGNPPRPGPLTAGNGPAPVGGPNKPGPTMTPLANKPEPSLQRMDAPKPAPSTPVGIGTPGNGLSHNMGIPHASNTPKLQTGSNLGQSSVPGKIASHILAEELGKEAAAFGGIPARMIGKFAPINARREELEPEEEERLAEAKTHWFPDPIQTQSTPITDLIADPKRQGLLAGLLGAGVGGAGGYLAGSALPEGLGGGKYAPLIGAAAGALGLGSVTGLSRWNDQNHKVHRLEESMRRLPPGSTKRDLDIEEMLSKSLMSRFGQPDEN